VGEEITKKVGVGKYIPEVPDGTSPGFCRLPIVSGATPPSLWAIFIMPLHGIRHRQLRRQWLSRGARYPGTRGDALAGQGRIRANSLTPVAGYCILKFYSK
jgi:hypothetical protein